MKRKGNNLLPQDIIEGINCVFEEGILVTDVGQHQMFAAQYSEITEKKRLFMSGGLGTMGYGFPGGIGARSAIQINRLLSFPGTAGCR